MFVYGSLMAEEVVGVILKRVPQSSPATLNGLSVSFSLDSASDLLLLRMFSSFLILLRKL